MNIAESQRPRALDLIASKNAQDKRLCIGLDPDPNLMPGVFKNGSAGQLEYFLRTVVDYTVAVAAEYKPNEAYFSALGDVGPGILKRTIRYIQDVDKTMPIILDAKRADIGNTNRGYVTWAFDDLGVDGITVHNGMGNTFLKYDKDNPQMPPERVMDAMAPFFERKDKLIIPMDKTSNPSASEFQDLPVALKELPDDYIRAHGDLDDLAQLLGADFAPLHLVQAHIMAKYWNENGNLGMVAGATQAHNIEMIRKVIGDVILLVPGSVRQGGDLEKAVKPALNSEDEGFIINLSRDVLYPPEDPKVGFGKRSYDAAVKYSEMINNARGEAIAAKNR